MSELEHLFEILWDDLFPDIDLYKEVKVIPKRRFRFDYAHLPSKTLIEINGGIYRKMGHSSPEGIKRDYEKNNLAILEGYRVFNLSSEMINDEWLTKIADFIKRTVKHES